MMASISLSGTSPPAQSPRKSATRSHPTPWPEGHRSPAASADGRRVHSSGSCGEKARWPPPERAGTDVWRHGRFSAFRLMSCLSSFPYESLTFVNSASFVLTVASCVLILFVSYERTMHNIEQKTQVVKRFLRFSSAFCEFLCFPDFSITKIRSRNSPSFVPEKIPKGATGRHL